MSIPVKANAQLAFQLGSKTKLAIFPVSNSRVVRVATVRDESGNFVSPGEGNSKESENFVFLFSKGLQKSWKGNVVSKIFVKESILGSFFAGFIATGFVLGHHCEE